MQDAIPHRSPGHRWLGAQLPGQRRAAEPIEQSELDWYQRRPVPAGAILELGRGDTEGFDKGRFRVWGRREVQSQIPAQAGGDLLESSSAGKDLRVLVGGKLTARRRCVLAASDMLGCIGKGGQRVERGDPAPRPHVERHVRPVMCP